MKKTTFLAFILFYSQGVHETEASCLPSKLLTTLSAYGRRAARGLCSKDCLKDIGIAYSLGMGLTGIHELGHALMAKLFYGCPLDITIGAHPSNTHILDLGKLKLGLNPTKGFSFSSRPINTSPIKEGIIYLAGPAFSTISSLLAFILLKKYTKKLPATEATLLLNLFNDTIGQIILGFTDSQLDGYQVRRCLREYFNSMPARTLACKT